MRIFVPFILLCLSALYSSGAFAVVGLEQTNISIQENAGSATFNVNLDDPCMNLEACSTISLDYAFTDGTATVGQDYGASSGSLTWDIGVIGQPIAIIQQISVNIINDGLFENPETINVILSNCVIDGSTPCTIDAASGTVTILDDDPQPVLALDNNAFTVSEGGDVTVTVIRSNNSSGAISVDFSTNDGSATSTQDYTPQTGTLSWADGETGGKTITLTTLSDIANETDETFSLTLSNPQGGAILGTPSTATITIQNIATPGELSLDNSVYTVQEGGVVTATVNRSNGSAGAISIDFTTTDGSATANQDYTPQTGTLSWGDGDTSSKTITLTTLSDIANETDETFSLTLSNPQGGATLGTPSAATVTIQNNATPGEIGFTSTSFSVLEGRQVVLSVNRSNGSFGPATVNYTTSDGSAVASVDYTPKSGILSWADGESGTKTITVATLLDTTIEDIESFTVTLNNPTGDTTLTATSATVSITNSTQTLSELPGLTENQQAVAEAIDDMCGTATGDLLQRCNEIYNTGLTTPELIEALESINPSQFAAQGTVAIDFGFQQLQIIHGRITSLRNKDKKGGFSLAGFALNSYGQNIPIGRIAESLLYNAMNDATGETPLQDSPLGFFIKGQINIGDKDRTDREKGFEMDTKNITLGLDYQFTNDLVFGVAAGYGHTDADFDNNGGEMETHSGNFSTYGSYFLPKDFYLDWILSYSINDYDTKRVISYSGLSTTTQSNPMGDQYGGSLGFGKDFYVKNIFINPYARFEYLRTNVDEFTERGGSGLGLRIAEQSLDSIATTLGAQINQSISMPWGIIAPGIRFEWRHQFLDDDRTIQAQFIDAAPGSGVFSVRTDAPDRDYFNLGASIGITLPEGRSAFLRYETRLGQNDISNHTIEAAVRIPF